MKVTLNIIICIIISFMFISCKVEPKEIAYGKDHCHFCDMTVVDKTHAAEYTTKKGKSFTFDAIECLINEIAKKNNEDKLAFILVANYTNPGQLIKVSDATFLVSEKIKSPMGANLSAFKSKEEALAIQKENGGELFTWATIKNKITN